MTTRRCAGVSAATNSRRSGHDARYQDREGHTPARSTRCVAALTLALPHTLAQRYSQHMRGLFVPKQMYRRNQRGIRQPKQTSPPPFLAVRESNIMHTSQVSDALEFRVTRTLVFVAAASFHRHVPRPLPVRRTTTYSRMLILRRRLHQSRLHIHPLAG